MGYFSLLELLKKYPQIPWKTKSCILALNAERNIGKTTSALNDLFFSDEMGVNGNQKIGIIRNSQTQMNTFKSDFNARFKNKFQIIGNLIWSLLPDKLDDGTIVFKKDEHVGYIGSISTFTSLKSVEAKNLRWILFDEYNEQNLIVGQYNKFINLLKTLERFNKVFVLMMGNRDTPNNEYMVKWKILPNVQEHDVLTQFSTNGFFIEVGHGQFSDLGNTNTLANELAQFDDDTNRYLNIFGYASELTLMVVPYDVIIKQTFEPYHIYVYDGNPIVLGKFYYEDKKEWFYCLASDKQAIQKAREQNLMELSLDTYSYQNQETLLNETQSFEELIRPILLAYKERKLYFDTFDNLNQFQLIFGMVSF